MGLRSDTLITVAELAARIDSAEPITVVDIRWQLDRPDGRADYERGHIPGAVYADLDSELSDHSATGLGRHPLPTGPALQVAARGWGVRSGVPIVLYDNWNRAGSARAWWVLRAAGIQDVRILDGGLAAWTDAGHELATGIEHPEQGDIIVHPGTLYDGESATLTVGEAAAVPDRGVLIDVRSPERFRGDTEPVDPVAGHIPGARNIPGSAILDDRGFFRPASELEELFRRTGLPDASVVGVYCGSGVTATVGIAALRTLGVDAALFPGSWSQWSADTARPIATGDTAPAS
ncbi:sulfurtransferase [Nocardia jiangxiensis]|uniref:sulfurtransferase n=1 Tax=Nocardia jiangxiensis TaxID=282685 RepID=UPI000314A458|nr:sulfurtransferase [Nocardia jiangxiensis]